MNTEDTPSESPAHTPWAEIESLLNALPYSFVIAAVDSSNTVDDDPAFLHLSLNGLLDKLKWKASLGRIDAIRSLITLGNDIAGFLKEFSECQRETADHQFPQDNYPFGNQEGNNANIQPTAEEPSLHEIRLTQVRLEKAILAEIKRDNDDFAATIKQDKDILSGRGDANGISLSKLTDVDYFDVVKEERPDLRKRIEIIEQAMGFIISKRISIFAHKSLNHASKTSDTWPINMSHLVENRIKDIEAIALKLSLGSELDIKHNSIKKRGPRRKTDDAEMSGFTIKWVLYIKQFRDIDSKLLTFVLKPSFSEIEGTLLTPPTNEELFSEVNFPTEREILQRKKDQDLSDWKKNCLSLPKLSNSISVINQWRDHIVSFYEIIYPEDWDDKDWPRAIKQRMNMSLNEHRSRKTKRHAREAVSELLRVALIQIAKKASLI